MSRKEGRCPSPPTGGPWASAAPPGGGGRGGVPTDLSDFVGRPNRSDRALTPVARWAHLESGTPRRAAGARGGGVAPAARPFVHGAGQRSETGGEPADAWWCRFVARSSECW